MTEDEFDEAIAVAVRDIRQENIYLEAQNEGLQQYQQAYEDLLPILDRRTIQRDILAVTTGSGLVVIIILLIIH